MNNLRNFRCEDDSWNKFKEYCNSINSNASQELNNFIEDCVSAYDKDNPRNFSLRESVFTLLTENDSKTLEINQLYRKINKLTNDYQKLIETVDKSSIDLINNSLDKLKQKVLVNEEHISRLISKESNLHCKNNNTNEVNIESLSMEQLRNEIDIRNLNRKGLRKRHDLEQLLLKALKD